MEKKIEGDLVFVYEQGHIPAAVQLLHERPSLNIVALDFWIEKELLRRNIPFLPLSSFGIPAEERGGLLTYAQTLAREWYRLPEMSFFKYNGISIGEVFEPMLDFYLQRFLYYVAVYKRVLASSPQGVHAILFHSHHILGEKVGPFAPFEVRAAVDAARQEVKRVGATLEIIGEALETPKDHLYPPSFFVSAFFSFYNLCIGFSRTKRPFKIFASEYWRHLEPFLADAKEIELVLTDRQEIKHIPWSQLWRHRIRFVHPLGSPTPAQRRRASEVVSQFRKSWKTAKKNVSSMPGFTWTGLHWWEGVSDAFDYMVEVYAERIVADIESLETCIRKERPEKILLRASVGGRQHHFFLIAKIAQYLGIPSVELQHANEIVDPRTVHSRMEAAYLAAYGSLTREVLVRNHGYHPQQIQVIGSPRFDHYDKKLLSTPKRVEALQRIGLEQNRPVLFIGVPAEMVDLYVAHFTSYELAAVFDSLRMLTDAIPAAQLVLKFRPGSLTLPIRTYVEKLFRGKTVFLAERQDPYELLRLSDAACVGNSTLMFEAMIADKPVVLYPLKEEDTYFKEVYKDAGICVDSPAQLSQTVKRLFEDDIYRAKILGDANLFLSKHYAFDGKASERMKELLNRALSPGS